MQEESRGTTAILSTGNFGKLMRKCSEERDSQGYMLLCFPYYLFNLLFSLSFVNSFFCPFKWFYLIIYLWSRSLQPFLGTSHLTGLGLYVDNAYLGISNLNNFPEFQFWISYIYRPVSPKKSYQYLGVYIALWRFSMVLWFVNLAILQSPVIQSNKSRCHHESICRCDTVHNQLTISKGYYYRSCVWAQFNCLGVFKGRSKASLIKAFHLCTTASASSWEFKAVLLRHGFQTCLVSPMIT